MPFRLWDQIRDWVVLAVLLISAVGMMLAQNQPMLRGLRATALETTSWIEARFAWAGHFLRALEENETLRQENIAYSSELARLREARVENERLRSLLAFRDSTEVPMVPARIVAKDLYRQSNLLTLDVGRVDSVQVDMPVVDERGILGKVVFVSEHYSRVMPYLNTNFRVPAKILELGTSGLVSWPGGNQDRLLLELIAKTEPVEAGQLVVTSEFSGVFPRGYPIGTIDTVAVQPGLNELEILLRPAAPLSEAEYAFVLLETPDPEQVELESRRVQPGP